MTFTKLKKQLLENKPKTSNDKMFNVILWMIVLTFIVCSVYAVGYCFYAIWADGIGSLSRKLFWTSAVISIIDFVLLKSFE